MSSHHHSAVFLPRSLNIRLNHTVTKKDSTAYWVQEGLFIRNNDSENDLEDDLDMALSNLVRDADFNHYKCPSLRQIILRQINFDAAVKNETERGAQKQLDRGKRGRDDANDDVGASEPKTKKLKVSSDVDNDELMMMQSN